MNVRAHLDMMLHDRGACEGRACWESGIEFHNGKWLCEWHIKRIKEAK